MLERRRSGLGPVTLYIPVGMDRAEQSDSLRRRSAGAVPAGEAIAWCSEFQQDPRGGCLKPAYMGIGRRLF